MDLLADEFAPADIESAEKRPREGPADISASAW